MLSTSTEKAYTFVKQSLMDWTYSLQSQWQNYSLEWEEEKINSNKAIRS